MRKKFTLTEILIVLVISAILVSISLFIVKDMKSDAIKIAVQSNIKTLQTAVDKYAFEHNGKYPVKGEITLTNPQYIDIEKLYPKYIKSKLDYQKIKEQYYWVDVFGNVWGSTKDTVTNAVKTNNVIEWSVPKGVKGYSIYKVNENELSSKSYKFNYKKVHERMIPEDKNVVQIPLENEDSLYLISTIDEYGLESAPVGLNYGGKGQFTPILRGDGEYIFELSNLETMYWDKFYTIEDKPEGTSIEYSFSTLNNDNQYTEWTNDFHSLQPSKGLKIKIVMKSFEGKYPSIYDLRVFYHYENEPKPKYPSIKIEPPKNGWPVGGEPQIPNEQIIIGGSNKDSSSQTETGNSGNNEDTTNSIVCGTGGTTTNIDAYGHILDGNGKAYVTYSFKLPKGQYIKNITIPTMHIKNNFIIKNMWLEYSKNGNPYVKANSISEVPDESCIKMVYEIMLLDNFTMISLVWPPAISTHSEPAKILVDPPSQWGKPINEGESSTEIKGGVPKQPEPTDKEVLSKDWETIQTLRFFAHSGDGQITHWIRAEINDEQPENTRILYRYATSNGYYWSKQVDSISKVSDSRSLMVVAYLQIHKDYVNDPNQPQPKVNNIRIIHERGYQDLSLVKPTVTIMPVKNNNEGRDVISDASIIDWQYEAFDPRGLDILEVEWAGDKREQYPVGTYEVKLRVRNSSNYWSDWVTYQFEVKQEKPIAIIQYSPSIIEKGIPITWNYSYSIDPDGDDIVKAEWSSNTKTIFDKTGEENISLRVQDSEGNWSDWTTETIQILNESYKAYRIEAEDTERTKFIWTTGLPCYSYQILDNEMASNNKTRKLSTCSSNGYHYRSGLELTFEGVGLDISFNAGSKANIYIDNKKYTTYINNTNQFEIYKIRGLDKTTHKLYIEAFDFNMPVEIDYIDVFTMDNTPIIYDIYAKTINDKNEESIGTNNSLIPKNNLYSKVYYRIKHDSTLNVFVKNSNGDVIRNLVTNKPVLGGTYEEYSTIWDGRSNNGQLVPTGEYYFTIVAKDEKSKLSSIKEIMIFVDNDQPIYRIEGEDTTNVTFYNSNSLCKNATSVNKEEIVSDASNGKVRFISTCYSSGSNHISSLKHTFNGYGADIVFNGETKGEIWVDGTKIGEIDNQEGKLLYPIRGLSNSNHTIELKTKIPATQIRLDYIDIYNTDSKPSITNISFRGIDENNLEVNVENNTVIPSLNLKTKVYYELDKNAYTTILIKDKNNQTVKTLLSNKLQTAGTFSTHTVIWDGKDNNDNIVPTGEYDMVFSLLSADGKHITNTSKSIFVDNTSWNKIEAEDKTKVVYVSSYSMCNPSVYKVQSLASASNGQIGWTSTCYASGANRYSSMKLQFTGTGVDVIYYNSLYTSIYIDNVLVDTLNTSFTDKFGIFSIRNLANGNHTLELRTTNSGTKDVRVDYFRVVP